MELVTKPNIDFGWKEKNKKINMQTKSYCRDILGDSVSVESGMEKQVKKYGTFKKPKSNTSSSFVQTTAAALASMT